MFEWKSNQIYPDKNNHEIFVISKAYEFCGFLFYQNDNFNNEKDFEPYLENDEGYFNIPWSKVDRWVSYTDFVKEFAPEFSNKELIKKEKEKYIIEKQEKEQQKIEEVFKDFDKTKKYNIVILEANPESYSEIKYPTIFEYENQTPTAFKYYDNEKYIEFEISCNYLTYINASVENIFNNDVQHTNNRCYIISNKKSIKDLKKIIIEYYTKHLLTRISNSKKDINMYKTFIKKMKEL